MSKQVFIKHVVRTKNSLNFTAFIQDCSFLLLVFQLIMELDCESELTPLLSTRLKEPIHSGAKFFLEVKFVFNVGDFTKSPIGEVSCLKNLILNLSRIHHIMGWILKIIGGQLLFCSEFCSHCWIIDGADGIIQGPLNELSYFPQWKQMATELFKNSTQNVSRILIVKAADFNYYVMHICVGKYIVKLLLNKNLTNATS